MSDGTKAATFEVKRWQTYVPCKTEYLRGESRSKPFVVDVVEGDRVKVWDPTGGQRMGGHRWIALRNLHETGTTKTGKERRTGFRLHCQPPVDPVRQELCGSCFTWAARDQLAISARGFGHSTCIPCMADIEINS
ncbi:hypothetical protein OG497_37990 [Streptomyces sp. NBC_01242]|uniref:hypothetical protein n=1 Tax=Streptomyces sp. NBC_01242 TaxID=2903795 RepID=UPI00225A6018|nr:hypothetical protein [Streptomyces sp. NBC_01242]MCX4799651.1 hypothetical protein [Streptomyces sp. NBC_01242]